MCRNSVERIPQEPAGDDPPSGNEASGISEIRELIQADLNRRIRHLPQEIEEWNATIAANANGLGIHASQIVALREMMGGLVLRLEEQLKVLEGQRVRSIFADSYHTLLQDLAATHDLWRIFRIILDQRQDVRLKPMADVCDLIAWDCYRTGLNRALSWGLLPSENFRPPPLTFLESSLTPATSSRGESIEALGFPIRGYRDLMLPMPIVLYPVDQAPSMWSLSSIAHEVGHNLDYDLGPQPGKRISDEYRRLLLQLVPNSREPQWRRWMNEIFADAVAVTLCGTGFVLTMRNLALALAPGVAFQELDSRAVHPPLFLRLRILGHMLVFSGDSFAAKGNEIIVLCDAQKRPTWENQYEDDAKTIAKLLIWEPVTLLGNHALRELNDDLATDEMRNIQLAAHWLDPARQRPDPNIPVPMPFRTVCAAAALAAVDLPNPTPNTLDMLQTKATEYFLEISRPSMLASPTTRNQDFLASLTKRLSFCFSYQNREDIYS